LPSPCGTGLRGEWEAAHHIAQEDTSQEGAWVHAWLHRIEGDFANARYYIMTIENSTSFWRYCVEIRGNYLALLSDGFPARDVLSIMSIW